MDVDGSRLARMALPSSSMSLNSAKADKSIDDIMPVGPPRPTPAGESVDGPKGDGIFVPTGS